MSKDNKSTFQFSPRPEAHAMDWEDLMPPERHAVRNLLIRIHGATQKGTKYHEFNANCFLVHGDRGTGKTTVLLSAQKACNQKDEFFQEKTDSVYLGKGDKHEKPMREDAERCAEALKAVVWLPVLDLEPLPPRANLLTTVLTRVRNALCSSDSKTPAVETTSIYEERSDSARNKLSRLINDATLMWEDIQEPDTRSRANRQVAAADIYARFQDRFKDAMDTLSRELSRGKVDTPCPIVLPIDNIDRSTDHLYSIVKLAQMVVCPYLWLVMAGDRIDVDTFLERAYWKELIRIGEEGSGATGKTGVGGEDEAFVMARRQAAAASHRLLPPSHRVEIELVEAKHTLKFKLSGASQQPGTNKNIRELLAKVPLITEKNVEEKSQAKMKLVDLFYLQKFLKDVEDTEDTKVDVKDRKEKRFLTEAAELGLRLPARGVIDLWQLAYWVTNDCLIPEHRRAEKIARTMLRNTIVESSMSSETGRLLQDQIIRRNTLGGTMLELTHPNPNKFPSSLEVLRITSLDFQIPLYQNRLISLENVLQNELSYTVEARPSLNVREVKTITLSLIHSGQKDRDQSSDDRLPDKHRLPDLVAAWITILYDVLVWGAEDSKVIDGPLIEPSTAVGVDLDVVAITNSRQHLSWEELLEQEEIMLMQPLRQPLMQTLWWPMPVWGSFIEHEVSGRLWRDFLKQLRDHGLLDLAGRLDTLPHLLATGWIACALDTFSAFQRQREEWKNIRDILDRIKKTIPLDPDNKSEEMVDAIKVAEVQVMEKATSMYEDIIIKNKLRGGEGTAAEGTIPIIFWLERQLPLLLSDLYVPMMQGEGTPKTRVQEITSKFEDTNLVRFWKTNWHYILADFKYWLNTPLHKVTMHAPYSDMQNWEQSVSNKIGD